MLEPGVPPQVWVLVVSTAVCCKIWRVRLIWPRNSGRADHNNAATPATCGPAMLVPLIAAYALTLPLNADRTLEPGAVISGPTRVEPL